MANLYVRSGGATGAWSSVYTTLAAALSAAAAGDTVWVATDHAETTAGSISPNASNGTATSPVKVLCGSTASAPPTSVSTGATVSTTAGGTIALDGNMWVQGIQFSAGDSTNTAYITVGINSGATQWYEQCKFILNNSSASSRILWGVSGGVYLGPVTLNKCQYKFGDPGQGFGQSSGYVCNTYIRGGSFISGTSTPSTLFYGTPYTPSYLSIDGLDMSNLSSSMSLLQYTLSPSTRLRNCNMPSGWSGTFYGSPYPGTRAMTYDVDSTGTNYTFFVQDYAGTVNQSTSRYLTAGNTDGTTPQSWVMAGNANTTYPTYPLRSPELTTWIDTTGASKTLTIYGLYDGASPLNNQQIWIDVQYLGASTSPITTLLTTTTSDIVQSPATCTSDSSAWTGASGTGPNGSSTWNTFKMTVTFTPLLKGPVTATVCLAVNNTVYIHPDPVIS